MADLTQKDIDNYNKLKEAFGKLNILNSDNTSVSANDSILSIKTNVEIGVIPTETEALSRKINLIDILLNIALALDKKIIFFNKGDDIGKIDSDEKLKSNNEKFKRQFSDAIEDIKDSLQVVEAETLNLTNGLDKLRSDSLFLNFITTEKPKRWTQKLIDNIDPNLNEGDTKNLIEAWRIAVNLFTEDARKKNEKKDKKDGKVTPFKADTFAHFFRIHNELEILYSRLAETEIFQ
jgi:LPS O-antigen subunit length determinant protein (WzzB/FepE family)